MRTCFVSIDTFCPLGEMDGVDDSTPQEVIKELARAWFIERLQRGGDSVQFVIEEEEIDDNSGSQ